LLFRNVLYLYLHRYITQYTVTSLSSKWYTS